MTSQDGASAGAARATAAQLKHEIDWGRTGDKSGGFDPAAAPLGVDEEAAGTPCSPELIAQSLAEQRTGLISARANGATPELPPDGVLPPQPELTLVSAAAGVAVAIGVAVLLLAAL